MDELEPNASGTPKGQSPAGQWHKMIMEFDLSNYDIDWDKIDPDQLAITMARGLAYLLVAETEGIPDIAGFPNGPVRIAVRQFLIHPFDILSDEEIASFLEEQTPDSEE